MVKKQQKVVVSDDSGSASDILTPSVRRILAEEEVDPSTLHGSGRDGRLTRQDVLVHVQNKRNEQLTTAAEPVSEPAYVAPQVSGREEKRVPMTRLRKRIAERLLGEKCHGHADDL